jgi:hypothetical protein
MIKKEVSWKLIPLSVGAPGQPRRTVVAKTLHPQCPSIAVGYPLHPTFLLPKAIKYG